MRRGHRGLPTDQDALDVLIGGSGGGMGNLGEAAAGGGAIEINCSRRFEDPTWCFDRNERRFCVG